MTLPRRIALWILYATTAAPLVFSSGTIYPYVVPRAVYLRVGVAIACAIGLYAVATRLPLVRIREHARRDPFLLALAAYVVILLAMSLVGAAPERSLFGDLQRMGGVIAWVHYLAMYVALRTLATEREMVTLLRVAMVVAVIVGAIAIVQSVGVTVGMLPGTGESRAIGTLGNAGYLGVYMLLGVAVGGLVLIRSKRLPWKLLAAVTVAVDGVALGLAFTRASVVGLGVGLFAGVLAFAVMTRGRRRRWAVGAAAALLLVGGAAGWSVARAGDPSTPGWPPAIFERGVGTRIAAWEAGADAVAERPFFGLGAENFRLAFDAHFDPERFPTDAHWNRAHNDLLESAVSAGIPGGLAWLALWGALAFAFVSARRDRRLGAAEAGLLAGVFTAYLVHLLSWFQDQNSFALLLVFAAYLMVRWQGPIMAPEASWTPRASPRTRVIVGSLLALLVSADIAYHARLFGTARQLVDAAREARLLEATDAYEAAIHGRPPGAEEAVTEYVRFASGLPGRVGERLGEPAVHASVIDALEGARGALADQLGRDLRNPRLHRDAGVLHTIRYQVAAEPAFGDSAVRSFGRAIARAPGRLSYRHMLSEVNLMTDRPDDAVESLRRGIDRHGGSGETYYYLAKALLVQGSHMRAAAALRQGYDLDYINPSGAVHDVLERELVERGESDAVARLREARAGALQRRSSGTGPRGARE